MKAKIDNTQQNGEFRLCGEKNKMLHHLMQQTSAKVI